MTSTLVSIEDLMCFEISEWDDEELCVKKHVILLTLLLGIALLLKYLLKLMYNKKKYLFTISFFGNCLPFTCTWGYTIVYICYWKDGIVQCNVDIQCNLKNLNLKNDCNKPILRCEWFQLEKIVSG